jgi:glycosyltransferase involved in cell wall biosynthesis
MTIINRVKKKVIAILYIGDFAKKNGPSIVDINITSHITDIKKEQLDKNITISLFKKIINSDIINVSGVSAKGLFSMILARMFLKKATFIMHGSLKKEREFRAIKKHRFYLEYLQMRFATKIICVSNLLLDVVKGLYDNIDVGKICYIHNGADKIWMPNNTKEKDRYKIITTGGGRKEKGVLYICRAIKKIKIKDIKLFVTGEDGEDSKKIKNYKFVQYLGFLSHSIFLDMLKKSYIFIQNSLYESFGLSVIEAASYNCKLIISKNVGALEVLRIDPKYIVDYEDVNYIGEIIEELISDNTQKVILHVDSWATVAKKYKELWLELVD